MNQEIFHVVQILILACQVAMLIYVFWTNPYGRDYLKWKLYRSKNYKFLVPRDSDWKEWLVSPAGKHWKVEADYTSFIFFKHNLQFVDITIKRKYDPCILQFMLIYEQSRPRP